MMNINLKYIYILFISTQGFYEIYEEKKIYISNFVNLKYLIHENVLTFLIGVFLTHTLLLIIFKCPKPWRKVILG